MADDTKRSRQPFVALVILAVLLPFTLLCSGCWLDDVRMNKARGEISQLDGAVQAFKAKYGVYPPSKIKLCSNCKAYDLDDPLDQASVGALNRLWPNIGAFKDIAWAGD